jgi:CcmD family protein
MSTYQQPAAPDDRATEYTAVDGNVEVYSGAKLLVGAYAAIWVVLMVWILLLWLKQASLAERLDGLERTIDRAAAAAEKKAKAKAS